MTDQQPERQVNVRGEILIDGPARLVGSFTGTIIEGRIATSGHVNIGQDADVHTSVEPDHVSIQPGDANLTYVPGPSTTAERVHEQYAEQTPVFETPVEPAAQASAETHEPTAPQVTFPTNQPQVPDIRPARPAMAGQEDTAAKQARARLAAYSRKAAATGTDDPSGWAAT